jgi:hypothetical protein
MLSISVTNFPAFDDFPLALWHSSSTRQQRSPSLRRPSSVISPRMMSCTFGTVIALYVVNWMTGVSRVFVSFVPSFEVDDEKYGVL